MSICESTPDVPANIIADPEVRMYDDDDDDTAHRACDRANNSSSSSTTEFRIHSSFVACSHPLT